MSTDPRHMPTFVVAGAGRAGSTAVIESLRAHPDVFVTQPKEPHYFAHPGRPAAYTGPGDDQTINRVVVSDREDYLRLYDAVTDEVATGEGSVSTLYLHRTAIPSMQELNAGMRVVVVLREPVARAFSSHQYLLVRGFEPEPDFLAAVAAEQTRRDAGWHHLWHYTGMSRYAEGVAALVDAFGRDRVGVWFYDDLLASPEDCLADIQRFVGVAPERVVRRAAPTVNASGKPRHAVLQQALRWTGQHPRLRSAVKLAVPFSVRESIRNMNLRPSAPSVEEMRRLAPLFADDLDALENSLGRRLPDAWRADRGSRRLPT